MVMMFEGRRIITKLTRTLSLAAFLACVAGASTPQAHKECECGALGENEGFVAFATVTSLKDWKNEWLTPQDYAPSFPAAGTLYLGEAGTLLVFFSNATVHEGIAQLDCDMRIVRPKGDNINFGKMRCFDTPIAGPLTNVYLTLHQIQVVVDEKEPSGEWIFSVLVTDVHSGRVVPLEVKVDVDATRARPSALPAVKTESLSDGL